MFLREIASLCCQMADIECDETVFANSSHNGDPVAKRLLTCANLVLDELYCDYATSICKCQVTATDSFVDTSALNLCKVLNLSDGAGNAVPYRYTQGGLYVASGNYLLTYATKAPKLNWGDTVVLPSPRISERIFAYGILAEYFFGLGMYPEAQAWDSRYKDALSAADVKKSPQVMPVGRWF